MKTNIDDARDLIGRIRGSSDWENHTDNELITRSLRAHPNIGIIAFGAVVFYNALNKALPEYTIITIAVTFVVALIICIFVRRRLQRLQAVQDVFLAQAPRNIDDIR